MTKLLVPPLHTAPLGQGKHPVALKKFPVAHDSGMAQIDIPDNRGSTAFTATEAGYFPLGQVAG